MIPYVLLMFVPLLFSMIAFGSSVRSNGSKWTLAVGGTKDVTDHSLMLPVFFFLLFLLLSARDVSIGRDLSLYQRYFREFLNEDFSRVIATNNEYLYWTLVWLITRFTENFQVFLAIIAVITVLPIAIIYSNDRQCGFLKIVLFMNLSTFVMMFSGLRQAIAVSIGLLAYEFAKSRQFIRFLLAVLVAFGFHTSAIILLLLYPLYHIPFRRKHLWFIIPVILLIFIFNEALFVNIGGILESFLGDQYDVELEKTGAYTMLILFALFAVFAYVFPDEKQMDAEILGLRNLLLAAVVLQCFAPLNSLSMRMNYYYIIFIPILIPKLLQIPKAKFKRLGWVAHAVLVAFFAMYYLYTTYRSCQTGISALNTYPYLPFWK